jgi:glycosyltransferase involved in cell wall biosynthesis
MGAEKAVTFTSKVPVGKAADRAEKMRILHIIRSMDPSGGGPPQAVRNMAEGYLRLGHEVEVATLDDSRAEFLRDLPFPVHANGPGWRKYGYSKALVNWLKENAARFDGIVVDGLWQYHGLAAWQALHQRQRYAVFPHGMLDPYFNRTYPAKFAKKLPYWFLSERRLLKDAYKVLFTSESEKRLAEESFWRCGWDGIVVPYGTAGPVGDPEVHREAFYRRLPGLVGKKTMLYLGRIHPKKGCDLLIEGFARAANPSLNLVIAGPDSTGWSMKLKEQASRLGVADRIFWPGMLSGPSKWGAFQSAESFILPSHQENFGIAVAEALSCHLPVLISDKVNIYDEVQKDGAALVAPDTLEGTTDLIRRWGETDENSRTRMRSAARLSFESRFDAERLPQAILSIFQ